MMNRNRVINPGYCTARRRSAMPPKLKSGTNKRTTTASRSIPSTSDEVCSLCCRAIVDGKDDVLLCEGVQSCNRWMHRYCAGVSVEHYESLDQSPLPFNCSLCVQRKQAAIIDELKSTIAALTAEVAELRSAVSVQQLENNDQSKWSDVVARRPRRPRIATRSQNRTTNENSRVLGAGTGPNRPVARIRITPVTLHGGVRKSRAGGPPLWRIILTCDIRRHLGISLAEFQLSKEYVVAYSVLFSML